VWRILDIPAIPGDLLTMRVLIVEKHKELSKTIRGMFRQIKCFRTIDDTSDGEMAWNKINEAKGQGGYGLILCEIDIPGLDGISLLKRCREHSDHRFIPFIMMSNRPLEAIVATTLGRWEANDFVIKPFSLEILEQRVIQVLRCSRSPEEQLYRHAESLKQNNSLEETFSLIEKWEKDNRLARAKWLNLKGECLMKLDQLEEAASEFKKATSLSDVFIKAYENYAEVQQRLGNIEEAIDALQRIDCLTLPDSERTLSLGAMMLKAGQEKDAKERLHAVVRDSGRGGKAALARRVAQLFLEADLLEDAVLLLKMIVLLDSSDMETHNRLGIALRQQGKYEESERCYLNALQIEPHHAGLYHNLGVLYVAEGSFDKAKKCFQKALIFDPLSGESRRMLDLVLIKLQ
jgi:Flp pilus assembly protein TadD/CheY-like chemotaxis protein